MSLTPNESELLAIVGRLLAPTGPPAPRPCSPELAEILRLHHLRPLAHSDGVHELEISSRQCAALAAFHRRTLEHVGEALAEHELRWTPIKGATYAWSLYARPEHRPMSDLDILVPGEDFARACQALKAIGFVERSVSTRTRHAQTFTRAAHEIVDLHRNILQPMRGNAGLGRVWKKARLAGDFRGRWQLDLVDQCWIHVAHMARHEFVVPLIGYVDLQRMLETMTAQQHGQLARELKSLRLDYALVVARDVMSRLLHPQPPNLGQPRLRIIAPTLEELARGRHRSRPEQIMKKLALFPRDSLALGMGWALRAVEDRLIQSRSK